ncbi:MAG: penicillin-binding protein activator [Proteobacteria bacterium]|nr:penicillin-binding protein activator [Pseudomonadota bacterium]
MMRFNIHGYQLMTSIYSWCNRISSLLLVALVLLLATGPATAEDLHVRPTIYNSTNNEPPTKASFMPNLFTGDKAESIDPKGQDNTNPTKRVKIGLLVPLSGTNAGIGQMLQNASELALFDIGNPNLIVLPIDTQDTKIGAEKAIRRAVEEKVDIILGPVFSDTTKTIAPEALGNNINVISFSSDRSIAETGVFTLGFLPEEQIERVVNFAYGQGVRDFSALVTDDDFGRLSVEKLQTVLRDHGVEVKHVEYYKGLDEKLSARIKSLITATGGSLDSKKSSNLPPRSQALLVPEGGKNLQSIAARIFRHGVDSNHIRLIGSGQWDDPLILNEPKLQDSWFASSAPVQREAFEKHFNTVYGYKPIRMASLAYDGVSLIAILARKDDLSRAALLDERGFAGVNGIFRFRKDGTIERALSILEVNDGKFKEIDPAPTSFGN